MRQPRSKCVNRDQYDAILFDLDGVITNTANLHAKCWKQMFDEYLQKRAIERRVSLNVLDQVRIDPGILIERFVALLERFSA